MLAVLWSSYAFSAGSSCRACEKWTLDLEATGSIFWIQGFVSPTSSVLLIYRLPRDTSNTSDIEWETSYHHVYEIKDTNDVRRSDQAAILIWWSHCRYDLISSWHTMKLEYHQWRVIIAQKALKPSLRKDPLGIRYPWGDWLRRLYKVCYIQSMRAVHEPQKFI